MSKNTADKNMLVIDFMTEKFKFVVKDQCASFAVQKYNFYIVKFVIILLSTRENQSQHLFPFTW